MFEQTMPFEIIQNVLFEYCNGDDQMHLKKLYYDDKLEITDLFNIDDNIKKTLCDESLKLFKNLKRLDVNGNKYITNSGIQNMKLHTLDASYNKNITDDEI